MDKMDFRLGQMQVALEMPPFFVNFDKREFNHDKGRESGKKSSVLRLHL
jgi:hypothetical protein